MSELEEIKLTGESKDIVLENISKLKEIFPEIFAEDKIDFDKLKKNLGEYIDYSNEKYNFTWPGKTKAIQESQKQSMGTLRPCKDESKNWDTTQNLYIEGDNLEVLKLLQKGYYNKIKMIYVDPPYNTGKDFIYSDNYVDNLENYLKLTNQSKEDKNSQNIRLSTNTESNGRFHSNWLNMMYPRLKLARNLLTDNGIIFISIDDNEIDNLKKLCNEIFGELNFVAQLPTIMNLKGNNDQFAFAGTHEYTLVYAKSYIDCEINEFRLFGEDLDGWLEDEFGPYKKGANLKATGINAPKSKRPNLFFPIYVEKDFNKTNVKWSLKPFNNCDEIFPITDGKEMSWRWSKEKFNNEYYNVIVSRDNDKISIYKKQRPANGKIPTKKPKSLFYKPEYSSGNGTSEIKKLFNNKVFDFPKPVDLMKDLIEIGSNENDLILDLFSGSATVAHAIFKINIEQDSKRKFISIQMPEYTDENSEAFKNGFETICEIGKERIRLAGEKIVDEFGNNNLDIGFKVFKLDSSNLEKWDPDYNNLQQSLTVDLIKKDRTKYDLVYEIMLKYGIDLTLPIEEYGNLYSIGFGALIICLDDNITKEIANDIIELTKKSSTSRVVFKDSGFASDADKTNIKEILKVNDIEEFITI